MLCLQVRKNRDRLWVRSQWRNEVDKNQRAVSERRRFREKLARVVEAYPAVMVMLGRHLTSASSYCLPTTRTSLIRA